MDSRSKSNPNLFNNTLLPGILIKFPTITKLFYQGDNLQENKNMYRTSTMKITAKSTHTSLYGGVNAHASTFRLVELPSDQHLMKICMMEINQHANRNKSVQKQLFTVDKDGRGCKKMSKTLIKKQKSISILKNNIKLQQDNPSKLLVNKALINSLNINDTANDKYQKNKTQSLFKIKINQNNFSIPENKINIHELYVQVIAALGLFNGQVIISNTKSFQRIRRAKIQKGNNGSLVKQTIKKRTWWNTTDELSQANLIWTQRSLKLAQVNGIQKQKFSIEIEQQQQKKVVFQRNIDQMLLYYPKILQLFFTQGELQEIFNNFRSKSKKSYMIYNTLSAYRAKRRLIPENIIMFNHIPNHQQITSKKMLYKNLWRHYHQQHENPYQFIPKTYHLTAFDWQQKIQFIREQQRKQDKKKENSIAEAWFLKPGQNTNRGKGIQMFKSTNQVLDYIVRNPPKSVSKTYILQEYINPLLYDGRKFDIRCYLLCIQVFNVQTYYWYQQGYIRTSSTKFTMNKTSISIHLTNDAVQKQFDNYDKYQSANKLSYIQIDKYIKNEYGYNFLGEITPKMKDIATDVCKSAVDMGSIAKQSQNAENEEQQHSAHNIKRGIKTNVGTKVAGLYFQIFGLDFIISKEGNPYLLQVNTNPCLELNSNLLSRVIPQVIQNSFRIVTDVYMPNRSPNTNNSTLNTNPNTGINNMAGSICPDWAQNFMINNKFSLIYRRFLQDQQQKSEQLIDRSNTQGNTHQQNSKNSIRLKIGQKQDKQIDKKNFMFKFGSNSKYRVTPDLTQN